MKKVNATFSIPEETNNLLHAVIRQRKLGNFVTKALNDALAKESAALRKAHEIAEKDPARKKTIYSIIFSSLINLL